MERVIAPVANRTDARITTSATSNSALRLAQALRDVRPEAERAIQGFAQRNLERQQEQARLDVLQSEDGVQAFGDAVRSGTIRATRNPFYIDAYNRERAATVGREQISQLQLSAQTWPERADPAAFQERWREEIGTISAQFPGVAAQSGLEPVVNEITSQVTNANLAVNAKRITDEREDNARVLASRAIQDMAGRANGLGNPAEAFELTAQQREDYIRSGGTSAEFDSVLVDAITSAAYQTQDPEILSILQAGREGGPVLGDLPGVADQASRDRFNIESAVRAAEQRARLEDRQRLEAEGGAARQGAFDQFGASLIRGQVDRNAIIDSLEAQGHSPQAISFALNSIRETVNDSIALSGIAAAPDDEVSLRNFTLYDDLLREGATDSVRKRITLGLLSDELSDTDARSYLATATRRTEAIADAAEDAQEKAQGGTLGPSGFDLGKASRVRTAIGDMATSLSVQLSSTGVKLPDGYAEEARKQLMSAAFITIDNGGTPEQGYEEARKVYFQMRDQAEAQQELKAIEAEIAQLEQQQRAAAGNPRR